MKEVDLKLQRFLQSPIETNPVWLDSGETIAYIRQDSTGSHFWQMNLKSGERVCRIRDDVHIREVKSLPAYGDIYYTCDQNTGTENYQIYKLARKHDDVITVTDSPSTRHFLGGIMPDGKTVTYSCNLRDKKTFDIWKKNIETGETELVKQHNNCYCWTCRDSLSPNGRYMLYNNLKGNGDNALWMTDMITGETRRVPEDDAVSAETEPAWKHDSNGFYLLSNRYGNFTSVCYYDLKERKIERLYSYDWDASNIALSHDDRYLSVVVNEEGYSRLHIYDLQTKAEINPPSIPKGVLGNNQLMKWSDKGHKILFTLSSGKRPEGIWLLDIDADFVGKISENNMSTEDESFLVEPELKRFTSFDGLTVPYWLYVPYGRTNEKFPVVIDIHGGPESQTKPEFKQFTQYLISEGIAVVAPNIRGSIGYGKIYTHLDDVEKRLDSVRDIEALVAHLISSGIAQKGKLAVMGSSYGGFMTLSCAARYPDLWACAIDTVGMYDLVTFLENTAEYRRAHRESEYGTLEKHYDILKSVSPAAKIADIIAPIMIIQGRNDPRVPVTEAEQAVSVLRSLGRTVEYLCYEDEGHGVVKLTNKMDSYSKMTDFLRKYLF